MADFSFGFGEGSFLLLNGQKHLRSVPEDFISNKQNRTNNAINIGSACSVLFLSTTGLFPARRKILEHETQLSALMFFKVLETTLECSKTVLNTLNHCLLRLDNSHK